MEEPAYRDRSERDETPQSAGPEVYLDEAAWERLSSSTTDEAFYQSWIALQCRMIPGSINGVVVLGLPDSADYRPAASWPEHARAGRDLTEAAELAISRRKGMVRRHVEQPSGDAIRFAVAYPIERDDQLFGVVGLNVQVGSEAEVQGIIRQLKWGSAWLDSASRRTQTEAQAETIERYALATDTMAAAMDCERFGAAATAVTSELAARLACERVTFGLLKGAHVRAEALSHSATFGRRMNLIRAIESAMEESIDQERSIQTADNSGDEPSISRAHRDLLAVGDAGTHAALSVPIVAHGACVGAMTFEWESADALDDEMAALCDSVAGLVGPLLYQRQQEERILALKTVDALRAQVERMTGPGHVGRKLLLAAAVAATLFFSFYTTEYAVTAPATLEGLVQRVASAPFDGYVADAPIRAGDRVGKGTVLARLEDQEIRLDRQGWISRREQYSLQHAQAMAERKRALIRILSAQIEEAEARIELLDDQLLRTIVTAPFDALVVEGDLSQSLGKAVAQGEVLFRLAPLDGYRVILKVDERDVQDVVVSQTGRLLLAGLADRPMSFEVVKLTPVTVAEEGGNAFLVEAKLIQLDPAIRPGMEGIGKIDIGRRKLLWIWTHRMVDWARLIVWSWWL